MMAIEYFIQTRVPRKPDISPSLQEHARITAMSKLQTEVIVTMPLTKIRLKKIRFHGHRSQDSFLAVVLIIQNSPGTIMAFTMVERQPRVELLFRLCRIGVTVNYQDMKRDTLLFMILMIKR